MRSERVSRCLAAALALACLSAAAPLAAAGAETAAQTAPVPGRPDAPRAQVESAGAPPPEPPPSPVERVRLLRRGGGRLDWSIQGDLLAFDQRGSDGFYDLYVMAPDGRGERCLTCAHPELRKAHALNPVWHPSGQLLVFQVQEHAGKLGLSTAGLTSPDRGLHGELWALSRDGRRPWRLTRVGERGGALLDPAFSHEGGRLAWSERVSTKGGPWGEWVVRVARFRLQGGVPRLSGVETFKPGGGLAVVSGFTPDDRQLLVAADGAGAGRDPGLDLYRLDLASGRFTPVLTSPGEWDEQARRSPREERLAWTTSRQLAAAPRHGQLGERPAARPVPRELWWMGADGSEPVRLTSFNSPPADGAGTSPAAVVSDCAWRPDGGALAVHVVTDVATGDEAIYLVELADRGR